MDAGSDWVLGVFTDDFDVQYVGLWLPVPSGGQAGAKSRRDSVVRGAALARGAVPAVGEIAEDQPVAIGGARTGQPQPREPDQLPGLANRHGMVGVPGSDAPLEQARRPGS